MDNLPIYIPMSTEATPPTEVAVDPALEALPEYMPTTSDLPEYIPAEGEGFINPEELEEPTKVWGKVIDPERLKAIAAKANMAGINLTYEDVADIARLAGGHAGAEVTPEESDLTKSIINLANRSPEALRPILDVMGFATSNDAVEALKSTPTELMGVMNRSVMMAPWLAAKGLSSDKMRPILDDILAEVESTREVADTGAEIAAGLMTGGALARGGLKVASKVAPKLTAALAPTVVEAGVKLGTVDKVREVAKVLTGAAAFGGATGGIYGAAMAPQGRAIDEALEGAMLGAMVGVGGSALLHTVAAGGGAILNKLSDSKAIIKLAERAREEVTARKPTEMALLKVFREGTDDLSVDNMDKMLSELGISKRQWQLFKDKSIPNQFAQDSAAKRDFLEYYAKREVVKFTDEWLSKVMTPMKGKVDLVEIVDNIKNPRVFIKMMDTKGSKLFPEKTRLKFMKELAEGKPWETVKFEVIDWAEGQLRKGRPLLSNVNKMRKYIDEAANATGSKDYVDNMWLAFRKSSTMQKIARSNDDILKRSSLASQILNGISTTPHVINYIDRKFGTELSLPLLNLNSKLEGAASALAMFEQKFIKESGVEGITLKLKEEGKWNPQKFFDYMESTNRNLKEFPAEVRADYQRLGEIMDKTWEQMRGVGEGILKLKIDPKTEGYMKHKLMAPTKAVGKIIWMASKAAKGEFNSLNPSTKVSALRETHDIEDLLSGLAFLSGRKSFRTVGDMRKALEEIRDTSAVSARVIPVISSVQRRAKEGGIPRALLETDPVTLLKSWMNDVYRKGTIRHDMLPFYGAAKALKALSKVSGDEADMASRQVLDVMRKANGSVGDTLSGKLYQRTVVQKLLDRYGKAATFEEVDDVIDAAGSVGRIVSSIAMGNLLMKPSTIVKNMLQPMVFTAEEMGGTTYHRYLAFRAMTKTWFDVKNTNKMLKSESFSTLAKIPKKFSGDMPQPTGALGKWEAKAEKYANVLMWAFSKGERINRLTVVNMGDLLFKDAARGSRQAIETITQSIESPAIQKRINALFKADKLDEARDLFDKYYLQKTMFIYNNTNKSKYAHEVGPLMSMLTRIPTEVVGDITDKIRSGNASKAIKKYLAPVIYLNQIDYFLGGMRENSENFDNVANLLIGSGGLSDSAGLTSILGYLEGKSGMPPVLKPVVDAAKAPFSDKALDELFTRDPFILLPFAEPIRYLTDDLIYRTVLKDTSKPVRTMLRSADGERRKAPLTLLKELFDDE